MGSAAKRFGHPRRRRIRRIRRWLAALVLFLPGLIPTAIDVARRLGGMRAGFTQLHFYGYVGSALLSTLIWGLFLFAASRRRGAIGVALSAVFVGVYAWLFGVEHAFLSRWGHYASRDGIEYIEPLGPALRANVPIGWLLGFGAVFAALAVLLVWSGRKLVRPRLIPALIIGLAVIPGAAIGLRYLPVSYREIQSSPPDLIFINALYERRDRQIKKHHVLLQPRDPMKLGVVTAAPKRPRNVILLLQESQRADETCVAYEKDCALSTRGTNELLPDRFPFLNARSNASCTLLSMGILFTGLAPTAPRAALQTFPFLWEIADAAGYDTAYLTSQHMMYANVYLYLNEHPGRVVTATHLDPLSSMWTGANDAQIAERAIGEIDKLKEPFFAVVHFSNNHHPRVYDGKKAPFQPASRSRERKAEYRNFYRDVVYLSDLAVATLVKGVRSTDKGKRSVLVYTSDHGEGFSEHGGGCEHCCSIFDEETRVPLWVDGPPGTLDDEEADALRSKRSGYVFHIDVSATVLDLLGVWDASELASIRGRWPGHPLTRKESTMGPVPISNVSYALEELRANWGLMDGPRKLEARKSSARYQCFDVEKDPLEKAPLPEGACSDLEARATELYKVLPRSFKGLKQSPEWGDNGEVTAP